MIGILEAKPKVGYIYSHKPSYSLLQDYINDIKVKDIMSKPVMVNEILQYMIQYYIYF